jgi:hypothetical protein
MDLPETGRNMGTGLKGLKFDSNIGSFKNNNDSTSSLKARNYLRTWLTFAKFILLGRNSRSNSK